MKTRARAFALVCSVAFTLTLVSCETTSTEQPSSSAPEITLDKEVVVHKAFVHMHGSGFTPNADIRSHLRRPTGVEFPVLPILTDAKGEFNHEVDSLLMTPGKHELWVEDPTTGKTSNVATFEVTLDPAAGEQK